MHERNCFVTLTYSPQQLPKDLGLHVEDWQLFAKRLRRRVGPFRFFHCGEYGDENGRPHYHAILFGEDFSSDRVLCKVTRDGRWYRSGILEAVWQKGFALLGDVSFASCAYVARYVIKKANGELAKSRYERFDSSTGECWQVRPEYVTMSRRPGIGAKWFDKFKGDVFPEDEVVHAGKRFRPPRFYDNRIPECELLGIKAKRRREALRFAEDLTPERLKARERVAAARQALNKRRV